MITVIMIQLAIVEYIIMRNYNKAIMKITIPVIMEMMIRVIIVI